MQMDEDVGHLLILNIFVVASGTLSCMCNIDACHLCILSCLRSGDGMSTLSKTVS